jgi:hypothetical protein
MEIINVLTPRPTLSAAGSDTPRPTQNSFDFDFVGNTLSPVSSPDEVAVSTLNQTLSLTPTSGKVGADTPFPTSNGMYMM